MTGILLLILDYSHLFSLSTSGWTSAARLAVLLAAVRPAYLDWAYSPSQWTKPKLNSGIHKAEQSHSRSQYTDTQHLLRLHISTDVLHGQCSILATSSLAVLFFFFPGRPVRPLSLCPSQARRPTRGPNDPRGHSFQEK